MLNGLWVNVSYPNRASLEALDKVAELFCFSSIAMLSLDKNFTQRLEDILAAPSRLLWKIEKRNLWLSS